MGTVVGVNYILSQTGDQADTGIGRGLEYPAESAGATAQVPTKTPSGIEWADPQGGVTSFNARTGAVVPAAGDYTPDMVGATPQDKAVDPDNWFFPSAAVINQRNVSGTITDAGYFIDRWKLVSGSVTLASGGLTLNGTIRQLIDNAYPNIQTVTALATDGTLIDGTYDSQTNAVDFTASGKTIQAVDFSPESYPIRFAKSGASWYQCVNAPVNQNELFKCQRYYFRINFNNTYQTIPLNGIMSTNAASHRFSMRLPTPLRINPGIELSNNIYLYSIDGSGNEVFVKLLPGTSSSKWAQIYSDVVRGSIPSDPNGTLPSVKLPLVGIRCQSTYSGEFLAFNADL